jgi:PilZ domain
MVEKRNNRRFQVNLPITFTFTGSVKGMGIARNLSKGGCQMDCMADIMSRGSLVMHLTLSPDEAPLTIEAASVRRCNEHLFSVAFLVMDTKEQERLRLYLSHLEEKKQLEDVL